MSAIAPEDVEIPVGIIKDSTPLYERANSPWLRIDAYERVELQQDRNSFPSNGTIKS